MRNTPSIDCYEMIQHLPIGVVQWTVGPQGRFVFANKSALAMLGYSEHEFLRLPVKEIFPEAKDMKNIQSQISRQGFVWEQEIRLLNKNKKIMTCTLSAVVMRKKNERTNCINGLLRESSFRQGREKDWEDSRELFRTIFTNSAVAILVADKENRIMAWNPFAEKMLGTTREGLFNKPFKDLFPPHDWQRLRTFFNGSTPALPDVETQIYRKNGGLLDVHLSLSLVKDVEGRVSGTIAIVRDISRQKQAEQKIKESENTIRVILDNSPAAITLTDQHERIVSWNKFAEQLLGRGKDDLYLKPVSSLYPEEEWKRIRAENIRKKGFKQHFETRVIAKDGRSIDVELSVNILKDAEHHIVGSVGIMQDITEQKHMREMLVRAKQAAEEASQSKSLFLANMSHEVRTPMNTIMGMLDLTLDTGLNDEQRENLKTAKDATDNLLSLLNDILDLSRVEAGKIHLEMIELNLENIVKSVCAGLSVLARKKNLDIVWEIAPDIPQGLVGDHLRLRQILVNLINNAIKFTFKGKIGLNVKLNSLSENDCELLFSVRDEGIGIPKDKQGILFNVFTQADQSTTRRFGGTGLGLAICKRLVELMGGRIWLESEEMKGSTFYFTAKFKRIKRQEPLTPQAGVSTAPGAKGAVDLGKLSILLAEDNIVNQKIAVKLLEKRGWEVTVVGDGQKVLDLLDKEPFDAILMDAQMPVLDGYETTRIIREREKKSGKHIPIVALTARAMTEDKKRCLDSGMDGYVAKPIDLADLYESIENAISKRSHHE